MLAKHAFYRLNYAPVGKGSDLPPALVRTFEFCFCNKRVCICKKKLRTMTMKYNRLSTIPRTDQSPFHPVLPIPRPRGHSRLTQYPDRSLRFRKECFPLPSTLCTGTISSPTRKSFSKVREQVADCPLLVELESSFPQYGLN